MTKRPKPLPAVFFQRDAEDVAKDLIGKHMVLRSGGEKFIVRIVETEAYVGCHDLACHASKGRTSRTQVMFGPGGHAYIYFIYGIYEMLNIVTSVEDDAQAVLIRAGECLSHPDLDLSGPGKLTRALGITRKLNGKSTATKDFHFLDAPTAPRIKKTKRIGVEYAKNWANRLLRFYDIKSEAVSRR